jgi:flagellar secretion chaperone FliS
MANPYTAYLESRVLSASPLQLVHLAYEGAIDAIAEARGHLAEKRIVQRVQAITKAQQIVMELKSSLDFEQGGDLSKKLDGLYEYMLRRLNDGNVQQNDEPFAEVQGLLETVDQAWKEIASTESIAVAASVSSASTSPWMTSEAPVYSLSGYTL